MDLRDHLLALVRPTQLGEELTAGVRLTEVSTELGLRLIFEVDARDEVIVELSPVEHGLTYATRSPRLGLAYRSGGVESVDPRIGMRVCKAVAAVVAQTEEGVLAAIDRDAEAARAVEGTSRIREVQVTRLLERAGDPQQRFYTLSPYVGCLIGCRFCYAQTRTDPLRSLLKQPPAPWGSYVDARVNAPERLAVELRERPLLPIKFCPIVSDPYQAVERRMQITRRCLEVLAAADEPPPVMVMTRSELILRDLELIASLPYAWVGASIPTVDDEARRHFEPRASSVGARLEVLRRFRARGVRCGVVVQPLLPGDVNALADALAEVADSVSIGVLRGEFAAQADFADPRYVHCRDEAWQQDSALALRDRLRAHGVTVWHDELPPEIAAWRPSTASGQQRAE
ncbi:MAG: radical SAM protein [Nannocystaceae bacterium]